MIQLHRTPTYLVKGFLEPWPTELSRSEDELTPSAEQLPLEIEEPSFVASKKPRSTEHGRNVSIPRDFHELSRAPIVDACVWEAKRRVTRNASA